MPQQLPPPLEVGSVPNPFGDFVEQRPKLPSAIPLGQGENPFADLVVTQPMFPPPLDPRKGGYNPFQDLIPQGDWHRYPETAPPPKEYALSEVPGAYVRNFAGDIAEAGRGIGELGKAVYQHPIETGKALGQVAASYAVDVPPPFGPGKQAMFSIPGVEEAYNEGWKQFRERWGGADKVKRYFAEHPFDATMELATFVSAAGWLASQAGLTKTGTVLSKTGQAIDPLVETGRGLKLANKGLTAAWRYGVTPEARQAAAAAIRGMLGGGGAAAMIGGALAGVTEVGGVATTGLFSIPALAMIAAVAPNATYRGVLHAGAKAVTKTIVSAERTMRALGIPARIVELGVVGAERATQRERYKTRLEGALSESAKTLGYNIHPMVIARLANDLMSQEENEFGQYANAMKTIYKNDRLRQVVEEAGNRAIAEQKKAQGEQSANAIH